MRHDDGFEMTGFGKLSCTLEMGWRICQIQSVTPMTDVCVPAGYVKLGVNYAEITILE